MTARRRWKQAVGATAIAAACTAHGGEPTRWNETQAFDVATRDESRTIPEHAAGAPFEEGPETTGRWYATARIPVMYIDDSTTHVTGETRTAQGSVSHAATATTRYETGLKVAGAVGYHVTPRLRIEAEVIAAGAGVESITYGDIRIPALGLALAATTRVPVSGSVRQYGFFANAWYSAPDTMWGATPYFGGGTGLLHIDQSNIRYDEAALAQSVADAIARAQGAAPTKLPPGYIPRMSDTDTVLAWQLGAGVTYPLGDRLVLDVGYRIQSTATIAFEGANAHATANSKTKLRTHFAEIGLSYRF